MTRTSLITFEGAAGVKKTHLSKAVFKELSKKQSAYLLQEFQSHGIGSEILELLRIESKKDTAFRTGNPDAEMFLFLSLKIIQHTAIKNHMFVIEDRGLPSIIGYRLVQSNSKNQVERFNELYDNLERFLIKSKKTIILTGNANRRAERLDKRNRKRHSNNEIDIENRLDKLLLAIAKTRRNWFVFDLDRLTELQARKKIIDVISEI